MPARASARAAEPVTHADIIFATCELDHIRPCDSARCSPSPDGVSRFQCPGLARSLTVYYVGGLVFLPARQPPRVLPQPLCSVHAITKDVNVVALQLRDRRLQLPEHPHERGRQTGNDANEQQGQSRNCHIQTLSRLPAIDVANLRSASQSAYRQNAAQWPAPAVRTPMPQQTFRRPRSRKIRRLCVRWRRQLQTCTGRICQP